MSRFNRRWTVASMGLAICLAASSATAQQSAAGMQGNALDANPSLSYSRYNSPVPQQQFNANLYVTGQVTGLAGFRGNVPYRASNQFRGSMPSASLRGFVSRSVGVGDVQGGGSPYTTSPYFDPNLTVVSRRSFANANQGRSSVPTGDLDPATRRQLQSEMSQGYEDMLGLGQNAMVVPNSIGPSFRAQQETISQTTRLRPKLSRPVPYSQGSLFGLSAAEDRYRLAREISEMDRPETTGQEGELLQTIPDPKPLNLNKPVDGADRPIGQEEDTFGRPETVQPGQDVFLDLMRQLKSRRLNSRMQPSTQQGDPDKTGDPQIADSSGKVVVQSLAGKGNDSVNYYLRGGQNQLRNGRFYEAASMFSNAARQDVTNPLPKIGAGLALFAAGEPVSAADNLYDALKRFPAIMEARVESANMLPRSSLVKQMQNLERRMKQDYLKNDPDMLLLSTFMYQNTGQMTKARVAARKLKNISKDNKILSGYAEYILTGRKNIAPGGPQTPAPQPSQP